jgi:hypothetical protein
VAGTAGAGLLNSTRECGQQAMKTPDLGQSAAMDVRAQAYQSRCEHIINEQLILFAKATIYDNFITF